MERATAVPIEDHDEANSIPISERQPRVFTSEEMALLRFRKASDKSKDAQNVGLANTTVEGHSHTYFPNAEATASFSSALIRAFRRLNEPKVG